MEVNMFYKMLGDDYDKFYSKLSQNEKYAIDLLGLLVLRDRGREEEIKISQEVVIDKETNKYKSRYTIEAPISTHQV